MGSDSHPPVARCGRIGDPNAQIARAAQYLVLAAKARAAMRGEAAADVDDVRALIIPALRHRIVLSYRAEADGVRDVDVLRAVDKATRG